MTSKAERKRRKQAARISLPGGESVEQRQETGRPRKEAPEDARRTALQARCRVFGAPDTQNDARASSGPLWGCGVGRMILNEPGHQRPELWNAAQHARKTQLAYDRAIGAPSRHAQVARILAPVDAMHADASSPAPDFRSPEEKVRQDTAAQMRVEAWIGHCDNRAISAFKHAVINDPDGPVRDWQGVLNCLQCIVEGLAGQTIKVRVRK